MATNRIGFNTDFVLVNSRIGIGTTSPTSKLEVAGDVTAFDFYNTAEYPNIRPTLDLAFAQTKILDSRITFTRASTAIYVGADGLIKTAAINEPRFDHNPITGESLGLLVEEARTNNAINSGPLSSFSLTSVTRTLNAGTSPDGQVNASLITLTTANSNHGISASSLTPTASVPFVFTVYAKFNGHRYVAFTCNIDAGLYGSFDLVAGTALVGSITPVGNGWFRLGSIAYTSASASINTFRINLNNVYATDYDQGGGFTGTVFTGDGTSGVYLYGMQSEQGSFPTSYIPTTASSATRNADVASITGSNFSSWYNQSSGSVVANVLASQGTRPSVAAASVLGITPSVGVLPGNLIYQNTDSNGTWYTYDSGILELVQTVSLNPNGNKFAWGLTAGASSVAVKDGVTRGNYSWSSIARTGFLIGTENNGSIRWKRITYYPVRLPDAQLQTITL